MTREELAEQNCVSVNTVKSALRILYRKLGALNRVEALRIAGSRGLL
jgi:LuxR family maltose regulon positive regulatory protein